MVVTRDVAAVIPTYREATTIGPVLRRLRAVLAPWDWSILVVDDSPGRATAEAVATLGDERINCFHRRGDGLASAVLDGVARVDAAAVVVLDGDGQHPPGRARSLVQRVHAGADVAVGSRYLPGGGVAGDWPLYRRVVSAGGDWLARAAVPTARQLTDPMSGFFAADTDVFELAGEFRPRGYKVLLEILARAPVSEIHEVPYEFQTRWGGDSGLGVRECARYLAHLGRLAVPARRESVSVVAAEVEA